MQRTTVSSRPSTRAVWRDRLDVLAVDVEPTLVRDDPTASSLPAGIAALGCAIGLSPVPTLVVDRDRRVLVHNDAAACALSTHPADLASGPFPHTVGGAPYELPLLDVRGVRLLYQVTSHPMPGLDRPAWIVTLEPQVLRADRSQMHLASSAHDRLTGLANRELFLNRLSEAVHHHSPGDDEHIAVVALDLDRFDRINERRGRETGDHLLRAVANRLTAAIRPGDYVSRVGGDEFAVLLRPQRTTEHLVVADRIASILGQPIEVDGVGHLCSPVIGVAEPIEGDDEHSLLGAAEEAVGAAIPGIPRLARRRPDTTGAARSLGSGLSSAAAEGQMFLQYQPIFSLADRSLVGLEALVRWEHPDDGLITPDEFIQVADETGAIVPLGSWVIGEACDQIAQWRATLGDYVIPPVSINLTCRQLAHRDVRHHLLHQAASRNVSSSSIRLEISEQAVLHHDPHTVELVDDLADDGYPIDIDEFGTGVSSLTMLVDHNISGLKISRSLVTRMIEDSSCARTVLAAIEIGRALDIPVTAIGVETPAQQDLLARWGCDRAQGYLLARPLHPVHAARFFHRDPASLPTSEPRRPILRSSTPTDLTFRAGAMRR